MNDWSNIFYFSIVSAALVLSVLGMWFTAAMPGIDRWSKRFFLDYFIVLMVCCVSSLAELILYFDSVPRAVIYFGLIVECLSLSMPIPMLTGYLLHCCGEDLRSSRLLRAVLGLWSAYFVLNVSAPFIDIFTYAAADNYYSRGSLYPLLLLPLIAIMLLNLVSSIRRRARLSRKVFFGFLITLVPTMVAFIVLLFDDAYPLIDISYVASALVMYGFALSDQVERDLRHQREIANQRASIMVLQMRPHFIYNTLTSVYCLCDQNPQAARQVIMDFTTYLRKNFTAIASATPIQFSSELEHTRAYLAVEQAQYEDSLFVDFDTPHTFFRVPPLTLQPIVENAIKHGRDPYAGPFHISIRTRKTDSGSEIIVADDGRGFQPAKVTSLSAKLSPAQPGTAQAESKIRTLPPDESEMHIALDNIRERLETMCGGSLTIAPNEGGGTVVTVTIPSPPRVI